MERTDALLAGACFSLESIFGGRWRAGVQRNPVDSSRTLYLFHDSTPPATLRLGPLDPAPAWEQIRDLAETLLPAHVVEETRTGEQWQAFIWSQP